MTLGDLQTRPTTSMGGTLAGLDGLYQRQQAAFASNPAPSIDERRSHLGVIAGLVMANRLRIQQAMADDFAVHATQLTDLTEVLGVAGQAGYVIEHLEAWAQPQRRDVDPNFLGTAQATMRYQPKGVVGVISPWNFPFLLSLGPLIDVLAAGNRAILKPSEYTPACSELLREMIASAFAEDHVAVVCGGPELGRHFTSLPWDHLVYTGSTAVGREVAVAAARNLVPVTLELGGKNPALVHEDSVDPVTVAQIIGSKLAKNGQVCISPDYCLVPRGQVDRFVELARAQFAEQLPGYAASPDCVGTVSAQHLARLEQMLEEARGRGVRVIELEPGAEVNPTTRQMPPSLVLNPPDDLQLMTEEIFGPILPVKPYDTLDEAIAYVNAGDRPLGLYVFAQDLAAAEDVLARTVSGGACINTCAVQGVIPALGFGGSGLSGLGRHRGVEGFREFSVQRGVVVRGEHDAIDAFYPPYSGLAQQVVSSVFDEPAQNAE
jgi:coniferyl-aldehyde dehydrogenase